MTSKKTKESIKIDPNKFKIRDYALMQLILGAVKGGIEKDRKKENNKQKCRDKKNDEEY